MTIPTLITSYISLSPEGAFFALGRFCGNSS